MKNAYLTIMLMSLFSITKGQIPKDTLPSIYLKSNIGFLIGTVESEMKAPFSFMTDINVRAGKDFDIGTGIGLEFFQTTYVPTYVIMTFHPLARNINFTFSGGFTFPLNSKTRFNDGYDYKFSEGYFINPEISYYFHKTGNKHAFIVGVGYRYQHTNAKRIIENNTQPYIYYPYEDYSLITVLNRFSLRLGYLFY